MDGRSLRFGWPHRSTWLAIIAPTTREIRVCYLFIAYAAYSTLHGQTIDRQTFDTTGNRIFPRVMSSTVRNSLLASLYPAKISFFLFSPRDVCFRALWLLECFIQKRAKRPFPFCVHSYKFERISRFEGTGNKPVERDCTTPGTPSRWHNYSCTMVYYNCGEGRFSIYLDADNDSNFGQSWGCGSNLNTLVLQSAPRNRFCRTSSTHSPCLLLRHRDLHPNLIRLPSRWKGRNSSG